MSLRDGWRKLDQRFGALQLRERKLIAIASCALVAVLGYVLLVEPALKKSALEQRTQAQQQEDLNKLRAQIAELQGQLHDPDAQNRSELVAVKEKIEGVESDLKGYDGLLVSPERMPRLLQSLLKKHRGLELLSLKTLPVAPLLGAAKTAANTTASNMPPPARPAPAAELAVAGNVFLPPPGGMYRHRMELTIAGSYADLLAYVEELQRISPRPLWSEMRLKVVEYPRNELTFVLYTLSLDPQWLAV